MNKNKFKNSSETESTTRNKSPFVTNKNITRNPFNESSNTAPPPLTTYETEEDEFISDEDFGEKNLMDTAEVKNDTIRVNNGDRKNDNEIERKKEIVDDDDDDEDESDDDEDAGDESLLIRDKVKKSDGNRGGRVISDISSSPLIGQNGKRKRQAEEEITEHVGTKPNKKKNTKGSNAKTNDGKEGPQPTSTAPNQEGKMTSDSPATNGGKCANCTALQKCMRSLLKTLENYISFEKN